MTFYSHFHLYYISLAICTFYVDGFLFLFSFCSITLWHSDDSLMPKGIIEKI